MIKNEWKEKGYIDEPIPAEEKATEADYLEALERFGVTE